jgi:hypothetical protein
MRLAIIFIGFIFVLAGCIHVNVTKETSTSTVQSIGMTKNIANTFVIEAITIDGNIERYVPNNLPAEFQKENLSVSFEATLLEIPPNVRMVGQPIRLKSIRLNK